MPRRDAKKDANHTELAAVFSDLLWQVWHTYQVAQFIPGWSDLICLRRGRVLWIEIKSANGTLTEAEAEMRDKVLANHGEYHIVRSVDDVVRISEGDTVANEEDTLTLL